MPPTDLFSIEGKTALVTGGSRGIGLMIARGYVEAGAKVNISSEDECRRVADELAEREDRLHILVNNAGATWGAPLAEFDDAAWDRVLDLNVKGVFHLTRFLVPLLAAAGTADDPGRVINIGSIDGIHVPTLETYSYSASKAAVHQMTRVLAAKLASQHIAVNAI